MDMDPDTLTNYLRAISSLTLVLTVLPLYFNSFCFEFLCFVFVFVFVFVILFLCI